MKTGTFVWISRHPLSAEQREALEDKGFSTVVEAGDVDAFDCDALKFAVHFSATGEFILSEREVGSGRIAPMVTVGVVHPAAALTLKGAGYPVAVSRNVNRAPEGSAHSSNLMDGYFSDTNHGPASAGRLETEVKKYKIEPRADLRGASLCYRDLADADLADADLYEADLECADLECADLSGANLEGAMLYIANLRGATLQRARLLQARLEAADLRGSILRGANLRSADMRGARLDRADLRGAKLCGADLRGADLTCANLEGADLRGAKLRLARVSDVALKKPFSTNKTTENRRD